MAAVELQIDAPDARRLVLRLEQLPGDIRRRLAGPIRQATDRMWSRAEAAEPERTGALRKDTRKFVDQGTTRRGTDFVRGRVRVLNDKGTTDPHNLKAVALEYGADGMVEVAAHQMTLDHAWARLTEPQSVLVDAYERRANITARHFLRDALAGVREEFAEAVERAVGDSLKAFGE